MGVSESVRESVRERGRDNDPHLLHLTSFTSPPSPHLLHLASFTSPPSIPSLHLLHLTFFTPPPSPHLLHLTSFTSPPSPHLLHFTFFTSPPHPLQVLAQCALHPGLSDIYEEILLQGKGCEVYTHALASSRDLDGATFGDASHHFPRAIPMGVLRKDLSLHLSPPDSYTLSRDDTLVLLAQDQKDARPLRNRLRRKAKDEGKGEAKVVGESRGEAGSGSRSVGVQSVLLLNWVPARSAAFVRELDTICPKVIDCWIDRSIDGWIDCWIYNWTPVRAW